MTYATTAYKLHNENEEYIFASEKAACEFLGVSKCTVASSFRRKVMCKGFVVERLGITTHHRSNTRLFKIWTSMHERCERIGHVHFKSYGGRGINVCNEWYDFAAFAEWALSNGYADRLTIDRIDNDGGYAPDNCRWITMKEQQNNKRSNHFVTANGERMTIAQCSERYSIPKSTVRWRDNNNRDVVTGAKMEGE